MNPVMAFIPAALDVVKRLGGGVVEVLGTVATKAAANPKTSAGMAIGGGLYLDPHWVVLAGTYITKFGRFVATIGAAMGG